VSLEAWQKNRVGHNRKACYDASATQCRWQNKHLILIAFFVKETGVARNKTMWQHIAVYIIIGFASLHVLSALAVSLGFDGDLDEDENEDEDDS